MPLPLRAASAAILAVALAVLPLALDHCSALCETHHDTAASTPSCHHSSPATARIVGGGTPCGHDHNAAVAAVSGTVVTPERGFHTGTAVVTSPADTAGSPWEFVARRRLPDHSSQPHERLPPPRI